MAKKKKLKLKPRPAQQQPARLTEGLREARALVTRGKWDDAVDGLEELDDHYPGRPAILGLLADAYFQLGETVHMLEVAEEWRKAAPNDPAALFSLMRGYAAMEYPALSLRAARQFLDRFPDDPQAEAVRQLAQITDKTLQEPRPELGVTAVEGIELAELHEQTRLHILMNRYPQARRSAEALIARFPRFAPAYNNLALTYLIEGDLERAVQIEEQVLAFEPDNVHALANLARYHMVLGRPEAARTAADRMRASTAPAADRPQKEAEALAFLGDDAGVLQIVQQAGEAADAFLLHLGGVAAWRLGHEAEARRLWQAALRLDPDHELTQAALADLKRPVGQRDGPQALSLQDWMPLQVPIALTEAIERGSRRGEAAIQPAARSFLERYSYLEALAPTLLERGGRAGREFMVLLAGMARTPRLLEAVRDFALSQHGPDDLRLQAAQLAAQNGQLPSGRIRLWREGQWQDTLLMGFELHGEPVRERKHSRQVERWMEAALQASQRGDDAEAERLLKQALAAEPDQPDLLNNLAGVYAARGRIGEAEQITRDIFALHPDYLFARTNLARQLALKGQAAEAHALLEPIFSRTRLHFSEFSSFCSAQIEALLAEKNKAAARQWLEIWESAYPADPLIDHFRARVVGGPLDWLTRRPPGRP